MMIHLPEEDPASAVLIGKENERRETALNLIAAGNTAPAAVQEAPGSRFNNCRPATGGTDNSMELLDLRGKALKGELAESVIEEAGILSNRDVIPFDPETTRRTGGLRLETPGICSRGMGEDGVRRIGGWIDRILFPLRDTIGD